MYIGAEGLVPNEQIQQPIPIIVQPSGGLARVLGIEQSGLFRHILERPVAPIHKQRIGLTVREPTTSKNEHVQIVIVVVVGLNKVSAAPQTL